MASPFVGGHHPAAKPFVDVRGLTHSRITSSPQLPKLFVAQANTEDASSPTTSEVDKKAGRTTYRPTTFSELVGDAVQSILVGLDDGLTRMEVEFPAVSNMDGEIIILYIFFTQL